MNEPTPPVPARQADPTPPVPARQGDSAPFSVNDFLAFRQLITPTVVTVVWIIGAALITLSALASLAANGLIAAIVIFVVGNFAWRIWMEFVIVLFRIHDTLRSIERKGPGL
jgi:hypothetical protein